MSDLLSDADTTSPAQPEKEAVPTYDESGDNLTIDYHGPYLGTKDEFLEECGIDQTIWAIERIKANGWEVTGTKKVEGEDRLWKSRNKQITVWLKRRAPKGVQDGIEELLAKWNPPELPEPFYKPTTGERCAAMFLPADAHFGKRCWAAVSGADYDLGIVRDVFRRMVDQAVARVGMFDVEKVYFSHMGDFFQANNWSGTTVRGTVVDSVDDRFPKVFNAGFEAIDYAISRFRQIAPVEYRHIPGNHDKETSWYLARTLQERFRNDRFVNVDCEPRARKYDSYGVTAWMLTHGDTKKKDLPLTFATEAAQLWAAARHRLIFGGHDHTKRTDTYRGVEVHSLNSPSPPDDWHYHHQFVGNEQEAETFVLSRDRGPIGRFSGYAHLEAV